MQAQLIKLKGGNIITTSEEPKQGDLCFYSQGREKDYADWGLLEFDGDYGEIWDEDMCKKVIASELPDDLPTIDYNNSGMDLEVVDIHGKAIEYCLDLDKDLGEAWSNDYEELPLKMAEFALYNNPGGFTLDNTLEDIVQIIEWAYNSGRRLEMKALPSDFTLEDYTNRLINWLRRAEIIDIEIDSKTVIQEPAEGGGFLYNVESGLIGGFSNSPRTVEEALKEGWVLRKVPIIKNNQIKIMDICKTL